MAAVDIGTKEDLAEALQALSLKATAIEAVVTHAESVLAAIWHGGLLDAAPVGNGEYEMHSAATNLLARVSDDIRQLSEGGGTDLSVSLHEIAHELAGGRFSYRRVLEEDVPSLTTAS